MKKDDQIYIDHIKTSLNQITDYVENVTEEQFIQDNMRQDAVIRQLEVIGEATKRISHETRSNYPDVPWKDMAGMRDKLIHNYIGVDLKIVWTTASVDVPILIKLFD